MFFVGLKDLPDAPHQPFLTSRDERGTKPCDAGPKEGLTDGEEVVSDECRMVKVNSRKSIDLNINKPRGQKEILPAENLHTVRRRSRQNPRYGLSLDPYLREGTARPPPPDRYHFIPSSLMALDYR
jgi:hypothetical protein